jgi:hypothetical protein
MDAQRFDRLTRRFIARSSRRRALVALAAGALGAALGPGGPSEATARTCKRPQQRCRTRSQCCRSSLFKCGFSHGAGRGTCCGEAGAPCDGTALGCCVPLLCGPDNRCVAP